MIVTWWGWHGPLCRFYCVVVTSFDSMSIKTGLGASLTTGLRLFAFRFTWSDLCRVKSPLGCILSLLLLSEDGRHKKFTDFCGFCCC